IRWPQRANIRRRLSHAPAIGSRYADAGLLLDCDLNALGNRKLDGMGVPQREHHIFPLDLGAIAHADDVQILLESSGHAAHGVGHQGPRQAVKCTYFVRLAKSEKGAVLLLKVDAPRHADTELALGALHFDGCGPDLHLYSSGHRDRFSSNS